MKESRYVRFASVVGLGTALLLLAMGSGRTYSVNPDPNLKVELPPVSEPRFEPPSFAPRKPFIPPPPVEVSLSGLSDWRLVENTTFTGVIRKEGQLYFTYNPLQKRGKKACPS